MNNLAEVCFVRLGVGANYARNPHFCKLQYVNKFWCTSSHDFPVGQWHSVFPLKYGGTSFLKKFSIADRGQTFQGKFMVQVLHKELMISWQWL